MSVSIERLSDRPLSDRLRSVFNSSKYQNSLFCSREARTNYRVTARRHLKIRFENGKTIRRGRNCFRSDRAYRPRPVAAVGEQAAAIVDFLNPKLLKAKTQAPQHHTFPANAFWLRFTGFELVVQLHWASPVFSTATFNLRKVAG